jgi:hypothetical protein
MPCPCIYLFNRQRAYKWELYLHRMKRKTCDETPETESIKTYRGMKVDPLVRENRRREGRVTLVFLEYEGISTTLHSKHISTLSLEIRILLLHFCCRKQNVLRTERGLFLVPSLGHDEACSQVTPTFWITYPRFELCNLRILSSGMRCRVIW